MNYSIVIPYRDRLNHLEILAPILRNKFPYAEIILVEQGDDKKFCKSVLLNIGYHHAKNDIIIFHDVDYIPTKSTTYYDGTSEVYLPVRYVNFVYNDFTEKPTNEIPSGYRHFCDGVDDDFFGGVMVFKKSSFHKINGACTLYKGWGCEESDIRNRCMWHNINFVRNSSNKFLALDHVDNAPSFADQDFINNINRVQQSQRYLNFGLNTTFSDNKYIDPLVNGVDKWIMATDFDGPTNIIHSSFNFDEGEE